MAGRVRLIKKVVDRATTNGSPYWDSDLPGFGLRVGESGTKTFFLRYRPRGAGREGVKRYFTIGRYGPLTPDQARTRAKEVLGQVALGQDPAAALADARAAATVADLAVEYLERGPAKAQAGDVRSVQGLPRSIRRPRNWQASGRRPSTGRRSRRSTPRSASAIPSSRTAP